MNRRAWLLSLAGALCLRGQQDTNKDWVCPMDPDVRSDKPGKCPRCGMSLVLGIPERLEYPIEITQKPDPVRPGETLVLQFRILHPLTGKLVKQFEIVHEKPFHLFLVSENLEFFAHEHPVQQSDGSFELAIRLPLGGMYRALTDFYPAGSVPQLAAGTIFVSGQAPPEKLVAETAPVECQNLTATLRTEPEPLLAGLENRLTFSLDPVEELQPYLGAWGHMLAASSDLIDMLHIHPFLVRGGDIQFNVIFPRAGMYRIWTQFQRAGVVNTTVFTVDVKSL